jgi:molybdopterin-guanine dinucleotide biosynthesis adapter protein
MIENKVPIISFVGTSKSGKTTFIEKLIPLLKEMGLRVAVIKHHHLNFEIDTIGKDTYRYKRAGASIAILSSPYKIAFVKDLEKELPLQEIVSGYINDVDLVITEGYKQENIPKIEVFRHGKEIAPLCLHDDKIVAIITDKKVDANITQFAMDDVESVAKFITDILGNKSSGLRRKNRNSMFKEDI